MTAPPCPLRISPWRLWGPLLISLVLPACASPTVAPALAARTAPELLTQIQAQIGDAACDTEQQCRSLAVGSKACGGPEAYLAWSTRRSQESRLQALATEYAAARQAENQRSGMASDCALLTDPGARCQAGRCVLRGPQQGGSPGSSAR
ncbi:hypothetical protein [Roseateles sp.]|jgi:hypothetical protein|uniref:hypothetical protein n=1 Tax=Roseateles sp. TaxID=1971397 RepID=UPI003919EA78